MKKSYMQTPKAQHPRARQQSLGPTPCMYGLNVGRTGLIVESLKLYEKTWGFNGSILDVDALYYKHLMQVTKS